MDLPDNLRGFSDFQQDHAFSLETCASCKRKVKAETTLEWICSFWLSNDRIYFQKCTNSQHNHYNSIRCTDCCNRDEYQAHKDCYDKLQELDDLVKKNNDGRCKHCRSEFHSKHIEYGVCHTCYGRFCPYGFYGSSMQYQYRFSDDKTIKEKFMICKVCWNDANKKRFDKEPTWTSNADSTHCQYRNCTNTFGYILGDSLRHHCRGCGIMICSTHCHPSYINYTNKMENTCPTCFEQANVVYKGEYDDLYKDHNYKYRKL